MLTDQLGVTIRTSDHVVVSGYGDGARQGDCGVTSPVVRLARTRVVILDRDGAERSVSPRSLAVLRRDGRPGLEGNAWRI